MYVYERNHYPFERYQNVVILLKNIRIEYCNRMTNRDLVEWQKMSSIDIVILSCTLLFSYMSTFFFDKKREKPKWEKKSKCIFISLGCFLG